MSINKNCNFFISLSKMCFHIILLLFIVIHQYSIQVKLNLMTFKNDYLKFKLVKDYYFKNCRYESKMNYFCQSKESENIENIKAYSC